MKIKVTKTNYLGIGYVHTFQNIETGERIFSPSQKTTYDKMISKGGSEFNPEPPEGYTWVGSSGGVTMVDTPSGFLGDNEYTIVEDKYLVAHKNEFDSVSISELTKVEFDNTYESIN